MACKKSMLLDVENLPPPCFNLFPELPFELRHEIWRLALPGPQLLTLIPGKEVQFDPYDTVYIGRANGEYEFSCTFCRWRTKTPSSHAHALLHVCKESREVALKAYDFCMSTSISATTEVWSGGASYACDWGEEEWHRWRRLRERFPSDTSWPPVSPIKVAHNLITYPGFPFQPALDTIFVKEVLDGELSRLTFCFKPTELKTDNIQSLALYFDAIDENSLSTWLGMFPRLKELILIAFDYDSQLDTDVWGITSARKHAQEIVKHERKKRPNSWIPSIRLMTETVLAEYVSNKYRPQKGRQLRREQKSVFQPIN